MASGYQDCREGTTGIYPAIPSVQTLSLITLLDYSAVRHGTIYGGYHETVPFGCG